MPKVRVPLAQQFSSRDGSVGVVDTYVMNGYLDKSRESTYVIKRPGTSLTYNIPGVSGNPQGAIFYNGFVYVIFSDILYRTGAGANTGANGITWTQAPMPVWYARSFFTATVFQNRIYVIGGEAASFRSDISYTSDGVTWSTNAGGAPFGHRQGHQCVVYNNQMFLIAGEQNDSSFVGLTNDVWSSSDGATWTQVTASAAFSPRDNHTVVVANNGMYLYGGDTVSGASDEVWFSVDGETWTNLTMAATGTGRYVHSSMFFQNKIYIIGGVDTLVNPLNDVWSSPDGQTWTQETAAAWSAGRYDMASTVYNNKMWLISGIMGVTVDSNVYSSSDGITWTLITVAPGFSARGGAAAVSFKTPYTINQYRYDTMWLLGGNTGGGELQEVWRADLNSALATTYNLNPTVALDDLYSFETFLNGTKLLIKNSSNFWVLESGTLTPVTDTNYPAQTVPGIVVLNSFAYVMTTEGEIRSCALDNPLSWPSLQFIDADYSDDPGVAIIKYLNYLVAFGAETTQFFYDAGNPAPGTALSPYQSATVTIGCAMAGTLQLARDTLCWVGQDNEQNWSVFIMNGITPKKISDGWVDKALEENLNGFVIAFICGTGDHLFYVLNFADNGVALAYDFGTKTWNPWNSNANPYLPYLFSIFRDPGPGQLWIGSGNLNGNIYFAGTDIYDDGGTPFDIQVQTDKIDAGNLERKFFGQVSFVSDITGSTVTVEFSDDDYNSYTTWGTMTLSTMRPYLNRGGSARRRAFRITQTDSLPARWEAIELNASQGES